LDTSQYRCYNHSCGTRAVGKLKRFRTIIGTSPVGGSSTFFVTVSCIHITTQGGNVCSRTIILYGCNFVNGCDINTMRMSRFFFLHNILWAHEEYFKHEGMLKVHSSYRWARHNPHAIRGLWHKFRFRSRAPERHVYAESLLRQF
jgi:hypothetical protein